MNGHIDNSGVEWLTSVSVQDLCQLRTKLNQDVVRGLFCLHGSWNKDLRQAEAVLRQWAPSVRQGRKFVMGMVQVDESDDSMEACCGDNGCSVSMGFCPPAVLPALVAVVQDASKKQSFIQIIHGITPSDIMLGSPLILNRIKATFNELILGVARPCAPERKRSQPPPKEDALRIFIAGDRSNVGKTSVSLGILGSLIALGYDPSDIAYIKPATQDESKQLLQEYCEKVGIRCVPMGPVIYYKGFTRAFLAGETESTSQLLQKVTTSLNELADGRRVILIDGVGFPAVGSICGTDNASVAKACSYSDQNPLGVIVVGPSGVGNAVDSYNLNASFFEARGVPVMGAIFNKLALDGYYSLENCKDQVSSYFRQFQATSRPFGFVPLFPPIAGDNPMDHLDEFFQTFSEHVNVKEILESARTIQKNPSSATLVQAAKRLKIEPETGAPPAENPSSATMVKPAKRLKVEPETGAPPAEKRRSTREEIEAAASAKGAQTKC